MNAKSVLDSGSQANDEIDLTPMLDVVFIMLIFFVVTASFLRETSVPTERAAEAKSEREDSAATVVNITADNRLLVDNRQVDIHAVEALISQAAAHDKDLSILILAHEAALTATYVDVVDAARRAGIDGVALKTTL